MPLIDSTPVVLQVHKVRKFDLDLRVRPKVEELFDISVLVITPNYTIYDMLIVPVRQNEAIENPFDSAKEDAASFFSSYESKENDIVHSTYLSPDLRAMSLVSENLSRPLAKFNRLNTMGGQSITMSTSEEYVALSFMDITSFGCIEILREGVSCIITNNKETVDRATNNDMLLQSFDFDNILVNGVLEGTKLPYNIYNNFCSFYYCIMNVPFSGTYYFSLVAADANNLQIDDTFVIEDYTENTETAITGSIFLDKGFHSLFIRQQEFTGADKVLLQIKTSETASFVDFTAVNCSALGIKIYAVPVTDATVKNEGAAFFERPSSVEDISLNSLYLRQYRPVTVLARLQSELLQNEFNNIKYLREPDSVLYRSGTVLEGNVNNVLNPYNIGLPQNGVLLDASGVEFPFITFQYNKAVYVTWVEITENKRYGNIDLDEAQCTSFCFYMIDEYNTNVPANVLVDMFDAERSVNIKKVQALNKTEIRVYKNSSYNIYTRLAFKEPFKIKEFSISKPNARNFKWGFITTVRAYGELMDLVRLIDIRGVRSKITTNSSQLQTVPYGEISFIPSIYKPSYLPADLRFGGEFLMFCLDVSAGLGDIQELGNTFIVKNKNDYNVYDQDFIFHLGCITMQDPRKCNMYFDYNKEQAAKWTYLVYSLSSNKIIKHDLKSYTVTITNTSASSLTDVLVVLSCPNVGMSYSAIDAQSNSLFISGLKKDGTYTDDISVWDTNKAVVKIPGMSANETIVLTISEGLFSPASAIVGTFNDNVVSVSGIIYTNNAVVRIPKINALEEKNVYVLYNEAGSVIDSSVDYDIPSTYTVDAISVTETSGSDQENVILYIDVSSLAVLYQRIPLVIFDSSNRQPLETVGVNIDESCTSDYLKWNGTKIAVKIPKMTGGETKVFLIRIFPFNGDPTDFIDAIEDDLIHLYHFNNDYKNSVNGDVLNSFYQVELCTDKEQKYQNALNLIGQNHSFIQLKSSIPLIDYSISFWVQADLSGIGSTQGILAHNPPPCTERILKVLSDGSLQYTVLNPAITNVSTSGLNLYDGKWHHVVILHQTGVGVKIYVDGTKKADATVGKASAGQAASTYYTIGTVDNITYFTGVIDEFRTYSKVLTEDQILTLYQYYDGKQNKVIYKDMDTRAVIMPNNQITSLFDPSTMQGTPCVIYKYIGVDESVLRWIL